MEEKVCTILPYPLAHHYRHLSGLKPRRMIAPRSYTPFKVAGMLTAFGHPVTLQD